VKMSSPKVWNGQTLSGSQFGRGSGFFSLIRESAGLPVCANVLGIGVIEMLLTEIRGRRSHSWPFLSARRTEHSM
jgi:hypothetical protein